jgi:hypothetical protein
VGAAKPITEWTAKKTRCAAATDTICQSVCIASQLRRRNEPRVSAHRHGFTAALYRSEKAAHTARWVTLRQGNTKPPYPLTGDGALTFRMHQ